MFFVKGKWVHSFTLSSDVCRAIGSAIEDDQYGRLLQWTRALIEDVCASCRANSDWAALDEQLNAINRINDAAFGAHIGAMWARLAVRDQMFAGL